eukprot:6011903-Prymnesium_polylepis.2
MNGSFNIRTSLHVSCVTTLAGYPGITNKREATHNACRGFLLQRLHPVATAGIRYEGRGAAANRGAPTRCGRQNQKPRGQPASFYAQSGSCLLYTSPSPRDAHES